MTTSWSTFKNKISQCLCPPGNGVFTVNTAKERKERLHNALFGQSDNIEALWQQSVEKLPESTNAVILGIASECRSRLLWVLPSSPKVV